MKLLEPRIQPVQKNELTNEQRELLETTCSARFKQ